MVTEPMRTGRGWLRRMAGFVSMAALFNVERINDGRAKAKHLSDRLRVARQEAGTQRVLPASSAPQPESQSYGQAIADRRPQGPRERWPRLSPRRLVHP